MPSDLSELDRLLQKEADYPWHILTNYELPFAFHLTKGMCDDHGCSNSCVDFDTLEELLNFLKQLEAEDNAKAKS